MYSSLEELITEAEEKNREVWELVLQDDMQQRGVDRETSFNDTKQLYMTMKAADEGYEEDLSSHSGLVGGDGRKLAVAREKGQLYCGNFIGMVMETAVKMGESNACMKKIVAAPTAGSCGVMPAVLLSLQKEKGFSDDQMTEALFVAAGIGGSPIVRFWPEPVAAVRLRSVRLRLWRRGQQPIWLEAMPDRLPMRQHWH